MVNSLFGNSYEYPTGSWRNGHPSGDFFFSLKQTWKQPQVYKSNNSNSCLPGESNLSRSVAPDEKDSSLHTTYSGAKSLRAAAAVVSGKCSLGNHGELWATSRAGGGQTVYTSCCDRYRAGPALQANKFTNKKKRLWLNLSECAWRKQEGVEHHASGWSHHQNGSSHENKKTLAGGTNPFIQWPTISRYKAEGDEMAQRCSGTETDVSASDGGSHPSVRWLQRDELQSARGGGGARAGRCAAQ